MESNEIIVPAVTKTEAKPKSLQMQVWEHFSDANRVVEFNKAATQYLTAEKMVQIFFTQIRKNPKIAQCSLTSLTSCVRDALSVGLPIDGRLCYIIPYGNEAKLIIGYLGLLKLAQRGGNILQIHCDVVCEGDVFEYIYGSNGYLKHQPALTKRGEVVAAYSYAKTKNGGESFEVMSRDEIEKIRKASKGSQSGPWRDWFNEMAKKSVFRRHVKMLGTDESDCIAEALEKDFDSAPAQQVVSAPKGLTKLSIEADYDEKGE